MKILYILGAYKPDMSANGVCSDNVINQLIKEGHSVTVLCNKTLGMPKSRFEDDVEIVTVKQRLFLRLCQHVKVISNKHPKVASLVNILALIINKFQVVITAPFWPVISCSTVKRFEKAALKLQKEKKFDAVIAVYTPIEALLAGFKVKKNFPNIKFYPYFLDSLSGGYGPRVFSKKRVVNIGLEFEKKIFPLAEKIVLMESSREHHLKFNSEFIEKIKFLDIPMLTAVNGEDRKSENLRKKLLYVGSISRSIRNPSPLIKILSAISDFNIECEFVGPIDCIEDFDDLKKIYGERLNFSGYVPHNQIVKKINEADILLNIGNSNSSMVPSKIFEYMSYKKPIISTYMIDDEPSLIYLSKYPIALMIDGRIEDVDKDEIIGFIFNDFSEYVVPNLEEIFYKNTPKAFTEIIF